MSELTPNLKAALHGKCSELIEDMIQRAKWRMEQAQQAANEESKSSMGDKYETTRAMMQREVDQAREQLKEMLKLKDTLSHVHVNALLDKVALGALIRTNLGNFYLAVAVGKFTYEKETWFGISIVSPIGQKLKGLEKGDSFELNGNKVTIKDLA